VEYLKLALIGLVAVEHIYFLYLEMFLWAKPRGMRVFGHSAENAAITRVLAANQGLYNGFLAAGLIWSLFHPDSTVSFQLQCFFLICIIVAAVYGGISAKRSILYIQGVPALLALLFVLTV